MERSTLWPCRVAFGASRTSLCAFVLLLSVSAQAQTPPLDLPLTCVELTKTCTEHRNGLNEQRDRPQSLRSVNESDGRFHAVVGAYITAAGTDLAVSMYQIGHGTAREGAFGAAWQDSPVAFAITKSAMTAAFVYGLQRVRKSRPKTAFALGLAATAAEGWLAARSAGMSSLPR